MIIHQLEELHFGTTSPMPTVISCRNVTTYPQYTSTPGSKNCRFNPISSYHHPMGTSRGKIPGKIHRILGPVPKPSCWLRAWRSLCCWHRCTNELRRSPGGKDDVPGRFPQTNRRLPSGNDQDSCGKSPFVVGKSTVNGHVQ